MAILRGGIKIFGQDIRIGLPRDRSLDNVNADERLRRKPGGHMFNKNIINKNLNYEYCKNLEKIGKTDTLIAVAEK